MGPPSSSQAEAERRAALHALHVLDTPRERRFDNLVFIAAQVFRAPIAAIVLVDGDRQWCKAQVGLPQHETFGGEELCGQTIRSDAPLVVEDAAADIRFRDNRLVTAPPFIRFYAGAPLHGPGEFRVGTLCVLDRVPRAPTADQVQLLVQLAHEASSLLIGRLADGAVQA